jgi:hypothetical protein
MVMRYEHIDHVAKLRPFSNPYVRLHFPPAAQPAMQPLNNAFTVPSPPPIPTPYITTTPQPSPILSQL